MGESTPLLGGGGPMAPPPTDAPPIPPPPAAAPPPPPASNTASTATKTVPGAEASNLADTGGAPETSALLSSSYQKGEIIINNNNTDDVESQAALSNKSKKKKKQQSSKASTTGSTNAKQVKKKTFDGPRKSLCHLLLDAVRYGAILASCMMLLKQIIPLIVLSEGDGGNAGRGDTARLQFAVRIYLIIFCIYFIIIELHIPFIQKLLLSKNGALNNWMLRGFLYTFIGVIGEEQDIALRLQDFASSGASSILGPDFGTLFASLVMGITTWIMISVGVVYFVLGLFCMQQWYEKMVKDYRGKMKEWKDKKKREKDFQKEKEDYKKYEEDRREGRAEWYDDVVEE